MGGLGIDVAIVTGSSACMGIEEVGDSTGD